MNEQHRPKDPPSPNTTSAEGMGGIGDVLGKLMAHPEVISYVASAIGADNPMSSASADSPKSEEATVTSPPPSPSDQKAALSSLAPILSGLSKSMESSKRAGGHAQQDSRTALLIALKPFVSKNRCEAIDQLLQFSKLAELLKTMR